MTELPTVTVEFLGMPRHRAGRSEICVSAATVAEAVRRVEEQLPVLRGLLDPGGNLARHFLLSLNGEQFLTDLGRRLRPGDRLILLSADAGG